MLFFDRVDRDGLSLGEKDPALDCVHLLCSEVSDVCASGGGETLEAMLRLTLETAFCPGIKSPAQPSIVESLSYSSVAVLFKSA
jgi:hypothetical protein